ncbi:hypothetical protein BS78_06G180100 [Paspalum vaginatum]|nr:hypothetical protein BS78_06G180100 [Paspalum vaginatum]
MARAPRSARRRDGGEAVRKGHWTAEEDAVLREHVRAHGPQDWSSIRSKGLLPRTGKSCRLRWVNKLRPDLKTGCKLSAEEKRVVLELQAQFGNKWARIATYLPGRTDNDVKNFWSTRKKRIARLMASPLPGRSRRNSSARAKAPAVSSLESSPPATVVPSLDQVPFEASSSGAHACSAATFMDAQNAALVPNDREGSRLLGFDGELPLVADSYACSSSNAAALPPALPPFDQPPPCPLLDFPGMPEAWSMAPGFAFASAGAMDDLAYHDLLPVTQSAPMTLPFFGTEFAQDGFGVKAEPLDAPDFFGDLPPDMLDSFDQLPPPLSPPATSSGF